MTQLKSYLYLIASIIGASVFSFGAGALIVGTSAGADRAEAIEYGLLMGAFIAPIFGTMFWALTFEPPVVPPAKTVGWRRYRIFMWLAGLTVLFTAALSIRWGAFTPGLVGSSATMAAIIAIPGWFFGAARADRARSIARDDLRMAIAERANEAILEIAKSDPWLDFPVIVQFLSKPYGAMKWMAEHGWVNRADLSYSSGVAVATTIPETIKLESGEVVPVLVEYVIFVSLLGALASNEWEADPVERVVAHLEQRAAELREKRLAKKV